jgi:hypothetical protein
VAGICRPIGAARLRSAGREVGGDLRWWGGEEVGGDLRRYWGSEEVGGRDLQAEWLIATISPPPDPVTRGRRCVGDDDLPRLGGDLRRGR